MANSLMEQLSSPRAGRREMGKRLREKTPRDRHAGWTPAEDRPDPLDLLQAQDADRIQTLLPIKYGRMVASPFAFFRGSAVVMANDLVGTPHMGQNVLLCRDAHLSNFGLFASPERTLVFDINDFDECYPGPWEWDVKRLAASVVVAGRENGFDEATNRDLATDMVAVYRKAMRRFGKKPTMDTWYFHVGAEDFQNVFDETASKKARKTTKKTIGKAQSKTQANTLEKLTHKEDDLRRINYEPPLLVPFRDLGIDKKLQELYPDEDLKEVTAKGIDAAWLQYLNSLPEEKRYLLERFKVVDAALRVGGVGSVGTRCFIFLLRGGGKDEGLILQLKQAGPSALEALLPYHDFEDNARRVVIGQRLMQAASDPFLGWNRTPIVNHDYYWRQLKDMKGSINVSELDISGMRSYLGVCAICLARAHARTGDSVVIGSYLGKNDDFDNAIADFAVAYADQTEKDHAALKQAIVDGRIVAEEGI